MVAKFEIFSIYSCRHSSSCCKNTVDALTFYKKEEEEYASKVLREKALIKTKSIGIAFVTFTRLADATQMLNDHRGKYV